MKESNILTTSEAALYLRVHPETLRNWVRRGRIPAAKFGNRGGYRFTRSDLDQLLSLDIVSRSLRFSDSEATKD